MQSHKPVAKKICEFVLETSRQRNVHAHYETEHQIEEKRTRRGDHLIASSSKKHSTHPPPKGLAVVEDVELVHKLVHRLAALGDGREIGDERHVVALLQKEKSSLNFYSR
jgi:hypothetical protein